MRLLRVLLAASLIVPAMLFVGAAWQERRVLMNEAARRAEKTVEVLEQHAAAAFHTYELIFARIDEHLRVAPDESEAARHAYLAGIDHELKEVGSLFLVDAAGRVTTHSRYYPVPASTVADRDYFRASVSIAGRDRERLHSPSGDGPAPNTTPAPVIDESSLAVGAPATGRFSGAPKLNIARAITTPDGRFAGVIAISVAQEYFEAFHRILSASPDDSLALVRTDGIMLARSPALTNGQMQQSLSRENNQTVLMRLLGGTSAITSPLDHVERIATFRKLAAYPIFVGYGLSTAAVLKIWHVHLVVYGAVALLAALTLFGVTWLALQAAQDEVRARTSLLGEMSRREAAETALRQAQKMEAVGQLTGGIAHDFNNLLAAVLGNLELLAKRLPDDPRLRRYLDGAVEGARRGAALTQRMLAFSRRQELKLEPVDLPALVRGMAELLMRSIGSTISVETHFPVQLAPAHADVNQLEAALLNLAVNARDAMPRGGRIVIAGREETQGLGSPLGLAPGRYVVLAVTDTGEGMDAATLARATEPFFTTKAVGKGTGLGLAMVHGLAAQSGGTLHIQSSPGEGTTVAVWLPVAKGIAEPAAALPPALIHKTLRPCRVLLVDDDPLVLASIAAMLEELGHRVIEAGSAQEALRVLHAGKAVDLVVTDQVMPGMTGLELTAEVKSLHPGLPVLLASGFAELSDAEATLLPRLRKPFTQAALAQALAEVMPRDWAENTVVSLPRRAKDAN